MANTRMNMRGTARARKAASNLFQGVVRVSSTTREIDTATRVTIRPAEINPWLVIPNRCPNPGSQRHHDVAVGDEAEGGRQDDDAGEDRDEQPHPFDEERE